MAKQRNGQGIKKVYNVPEWADKYPYIVVNVVADGEQRWFYGAYDSIERAFEVAKEIGGEICDSWESISF